MGRYTVVSDIHGNAVAFDYLLETLAHTSHLKGLCDNRVRCLGDLFGYYSEPIAVWETALDLDPNLRLGNHDYYQRSYLLNSFPGYGDDVNRYVVWTQYAHFEMLRRAPQTTRDRIEAYLRRSDIHLPRVERADGYTLIYVHGAPTDKLDPYGDGNGYYSTYLSPYLYAKELDNLRASMIAALELARQKGAGPDERVIVFVGHTHMPMVVTLEDNQVCYKSGRWTNASESHAFNLGDLFQNSRVVLVNGGSVGYVRLNKVLSRHTHAVQVDLDAEKLYMVALQLPEDLQQLFEEQMCSYSVHDKLSAIRTPIETWYQTYAKAADKPDIDVLADADDGEWNMFWMQHIRFPLQRYFLEGQASGDGDAYLYTADSFHLRNT